MPQLFIPSLIYHLRFQNQQCFDERQFFLTILPATTRFLTLEVVLPHFIYLFFFSLLMCANRNWFYRATFGSDVVSIANVYCFLFRCSLVGLATKRCLFPFFISSFSMQEKFINFAVFGMIYSTVFCFRLNLKVFENARLKMHTLSYR